MKPRFFSTLLIFGAVGLATASAQSALSDLTKSLTAPQPAAATSAALPADLLGGLKNLASTFGVSQLNYAMIAKDALSSLNAGHDSKALAALDKLSAAKLTAPQMTALKTARTAVDAYVLKKDFAGVPEVNSLVTDSVAQIKSGDFAGVAAKLQTVATTIKPTAEQKAILDSLVTHYKSWATTPAAPAAK